MRIGNRLGLISDDAIRKLEHKEASVARVREALGQIWIKPGDINSWLERSGSAVLQEPASLSQLLRRSEINLAEMMSIVRHQGIPLEAVSDEIIDRVQIEVKYEGYLKRQQEQIEEFKRHESLGIPAGIDYGRIRSLSAEGKEKLDRIRPSSIGQATRISGVTPADISVLMVYLRN
jgi:tRNA uridine 5-carboxymethylaminomethyl modification enzyme